MTADSNYQPQWLGITRDLWVTASLVTTWIIIGLIVVWCHEVSFGSIGFLWSLACLATGSLFGFIFGVPRAATEPASKTDQATTLTSTYGAYSRLKANTNMEQISDWLTKLLVGAGLVELKDLQALPRHCSPFRGSWISQESTTARHIGVGHGFVRRWTDNLLFCPGFLGRLSRHSYVFPERIRAGRQILDESNNK